MSLRRSGSTANHPYPPLTRKYRYGIVWSVAEQIARLSQAFEPAPGDIVFSGTPENVGPVVLGDVIRGEIAGLPTLDVRVVGALA